MKHHRLVVCADLLAVAFRLAAVSAFQQRSLHVRHSNIFIPKTPPAGGGREAQSELFVDNLHSPRWRLVALESATDANGDRQPSGDDDSSTNEDNVSKKRLLTSGYAWGRYIFAAAAALVLAMPDRTMTTLLATKLGGSAGFALAAGLCHILQGAAAHDRLSSDTYKRLNIGLLGFCALGVTAVPGEGAFMNSAKQALMVSVLLTCVKIYGAFLSFIGWKHGVIDAGVVETKGVFRELADGTKETVKGLRVQSNKKALTYRNCLLLVCLGILSSFMEGLFNIRYQKEFTRTWFEISLQWSAVSRLFMVSTMIYSLKDAAERDRLTGTTFIQMNILVGFWASMVGLGQAVYPLGFAAYRGVEMFAFSLPFFLKAYKSLKVKSEARKEGSG